MSSMEKGQRSKLLEVKKKKKEVVLEPIREVLSFLRGQSPLAHGEGEKESKLNQLLKAG